MEVKPVNRCSTPRYPNRPLIDEHPEILRLVPQRWRGNSMVLASLTLVLSVSAGYRLGKTVQSHQPSIPSGFPVNKALYRQGMLEVTPTFYPKTEYGPLPGYIVPASSITESETLRIVRAEAKKAGIPFAAKKGHIIIEVPVPDGKTKPFDYTLDEYNVDKGVGFEFVSKKDCVRVYGKQTKVTPAALAKTLKKGVVAAKKGGRVKVMFEKEPETDFSQEEKMRSEIKAFFKWLKSQGVI
jgi:hypothetical protein